MVLSRENRPFKDAVNRLRAGGAHRAKLLPLMFVAGDHAKDDMAGNGEDSLFSLVEKTGIEAESIIRGLGEDEEIQKLFAARAKEILAKFVFK